MEIGTVTILSMIGMGFTALLSFGIPLYLFLKSVRKQAWVPSVFIGALVFVIFAMLLEQGCHFLVLSLTGSLLQTNVLLYALYGGLAAALFEETGRYLGLKFICQKHAEMKNAILYGVGHGGIEAILVVGMTQINNLVLSVMINQGTIMNAVNALDPSLQSTYLTQISTLWTTPSYMFFMGGVERVLAISLQICMSMLVYHAIRQKDRKWWLIAFAMHFVADFCVVLLASVFGALIAEFVLCALVIALMRYVSRVTKRLEEKHASA